MSTRQADRGSREADRGSREAGSHRAKQQAKSGQAILSSRHAA